MTTKAGWEEMDWQDETRRRFGAQTVATQRFIYESPVGPCRTVDAS